jgi:hypothetical protein
MCSREVEGLNPAHKQQSGNSLISFLVAVRRARFSPPMSTPRKMHPALAEQIANGFNGFTWNDGATLGLIMTFSN